MKTITPEMLGPIATENDAKKASELMAARGWNPDGTGKYAEFDNDNELQTAWEADLTEVLGELE